MDSVAVLSPSERFELFSETAARRQLPVALVEKDFWVCWTLHRLYSLPHLPAGLLFKGGTSLSKVFNALDRFSEDVDLSLKGEDLGFSATRDPYVAGSKKQARRLIDELVHACQLAIRDDLFPSLHTAFSSVLEAAGARWSLHVAPHDSQSILFAYPVSSPAPASPLSYITPTVRLEIGARSDHWPVVDGQATPYAAEEFPGLFSRRSASVRALGAERTFWEKVTLLHAEYHRPAEKPILQRLSRHYFDVARLFPSPIGECALGDLKLLALVAKHKMLFFASAWASYETAVPGSIHIVPPAHRLSDIKRDYATMAEMFFTEPPSLDTLLEVLSQLELRLNTVE